MAIRITCPSCEATYTVDDSLRGKKIRCKKCEVVFGVKPNAGGPAREEEEDARPDRRVALKPVPKTAPTRRPRDEEEEEAPARKPARSRDDDETPDRRPASKLRASGDDDDAPRRKPIRDRDGDDEKPIRKVSSRRDDDDDDRRGPSRRKPKEKERSLLLPLIGGGAAALLAVMGLILFLVFRSGGSSTPTTVALNAPAVQANAPFQAAGNPNLVADAKPAAPAMDGAIPIAVVEQIKEATAFIKMDAGPLSGSGSGFVMRVEGGTTYIVTNDHVVTPPSTTVVAVGRLRSRVVATQKATITVVLHSGTPREQSMPAEVMATDAEADLAVLRVSGVRNPPKPIDFSQRPQMVETMPLFIFGFPFGSALSRGKGNPAITVGRGTISSLRRDERGDLAVVQINGDLNPGNSGGPVVDSQGRLIGVSVAAIKGTQIGMAIPADELALMLKGRVLGTVVFKKKMEGTMAEIAGEVWMMDKSHRVRANKSLNLRLNNVDVAGKADGDIEVEAKLLDPLHQIKNVNLHYRPTANPPAAQPNAQGLWDPVPGAQSVALKLDDQKAVASLFLPPGTLPTAPITFQISYVNGDGKTAFTQPRSVSLNFDAKQVVPPPVMPNPGGAKYGPENTVVLRITNVPDQPSGQYILDKLPILTGGTGHSMRSTTTGNVLTVTLAPVPDPKAFADKIDFGEVTSIQGRVINVTAKKLDVPAADADLVTRALFEMKSPNLFTRKAAVKKLIDLGPNERREEVAKALEKLINDPDTWTRQEALKALGTWGTKDNLPEMGKALAHTDIFTRKVAIESLGKIKDEKAAELIAARLPEGLERFDASKSLQGMGPIAQKAAVKYLKHPEWTVRMEACNVLKAVGTKQSAPALKAALRDPNGIVARAANEALQFVSTRK